MEMKETILKTFAEVFGDAEGAKAYFAPGRVNLIGEHTDYNGGHVFPCALTIGTYGVARKRNDNKLRFYSMNFEHLGVIESSLDDLVPSKEANWTNYPKGVIWAFGEKGMKVTSGMDLLLNGNIPNGSGLSSSASVEVLMGFVLKELFGLDVSGQRLALAGQWAEHEYCGVNCGIMDQLISALGKKDHALLIDCRSLGTKAVSMPKGVAVVIINSNFKRTLVGSEYNTRREQCETGARFFQQPALRDVTIEEFNAVAHELDPIVAKRVRHILTENARTVEAASALEQGDLKRMGELMAESHASMRDDFEITVPQIDTLVEIVKAVIGDKGGVRMTGGGFGGCIVALIPEELVPAVQQAVAEQYEAKTGIKETFYVCKPSQGAGQC